MSSGIDRQQPRSRARRHFLGLAGATGARLAAGVAAATVLSSLPAQAMGRRVRRDRDQNGANCFLRGTAICTPTGETAVEDLRIGDLVETHDGQLKAVRWIGHRRYRKSGSAWPEGVIPIHVARGAMAEGVPHRDLYLSPNHAVFIDGVLIRVKDLVNGVSIAPALPAKLQALDYFNIMLDRHQAILAEGLAVESFRLAGRNHEGFDNFTELERLMPAARASDMVPFAPILGYEGGRAHIRALLHLASPGLFGISDPIQDVKARIAGRTGMPVS